MEHLAAKLAQTGRIERADGFTLQDTKQMLIDRFSAIDYDQAKADVAPFLTNRDSLDVWSADFFCSITQNLTARDSCFTRV